MFKNLNTSVRFIYLLFKSICEFKNYYSWIKTKLPQEKISINYFYTNNFCDYFCAYPHLFITRISLLSTFLYHPYFFITNIIYYPHFFITTFLYYPHFFIIHISLLSIFLYFPHSLLFTFFIIPHFFITHICSLPTFIYYPHLFFTRISLLSTFLYYPHLFITHIYLLPTFIFYPHFFIIHIYFLPAFLYYHSHISLLSTFIYYPHSLLSTFFIIHIFYCSSPCNDYRSFPRIVVPYKLSASRQRRNPLCGFPLIIIVLLLLCFIRRDREQSAAKALAKGISSYNSIIISCLQH